MYQLHIANKNYSSWSLRPWVLMKEAKIPFTEVMQPFTQSSNYAAFRTFSPSGRVPCLYDGDTVIWDSLAIVEYLAESSPSVWPIDKLARAFARCAAAEMHAGFSDLRSQCTMNCGVRVAMPAMNPALQKDVARVDQLWSEGLARFGGQYLAGNAFTAVDAFYAPVVFRAQTYGFPLSAQAAAYVERILALPSMQTWYAAALLESWREPDHEADMQAAGSLRADFRKPVT
jgi:glutathione S-transferase